VKSIAIIPARGGSKRIPRKNIRSFCGKPIIHYPIKVALESGLFDEVMVSTDDQEIADVAIQGGAKVPFLRSAATSNDTAVTAAVISEVLHRYQERGVEFKRLCCIYPVTPLLQAKHLKEAAAILENNHVESVQPVVRFGFPPQRAVRVLPDGRVSWIYPEHALTRSQDLEAQYHDVGQFYWWKTAHFLQEKLLVGNNSFAYEMSELDIQDIDNEVDWQLAEQKYHLRNTP
jgi:N-acylneuraminate cytidylyltransferase